MPRPGPRPYECIRRAWHSDAHQPLRGTLIQDIFRVANEVHNPCTRRKKEWQEKLPIVVLRAEEILYSKANSESEYMDAKTLRARLDDAVNTMIRREDTDESSGPYLQPCIEAALSLGCLPKKSLRGQKQAAMHVFNRGSNRRIATSDSASDIPGLSANPPQLDASSTSAPLYDSPTTTPRLDSSRYVNPTYLSKAVAISPAFVNPYISPSPPPPFLHALDGGTHQTSYTHMPLYATFGEGDSVIIARDNGNYYSGTRQHWSLCSPSTGSSVVLLSPPSSSSSSTCLLDTDRTPVDTQLHLQTIPHLVTEANNNNPSKPKKVVACDRSSVSASASASPALSPQPKTPFCFYHRCLRPSPVSGPPRENVEILYRTRSNGKEPWPNRGQSFKHNPFSMSMAVIREANYYRIGFNFVQEDVEIFCRACTNGKELWPNKGNSFKLNPSSMSTVVIGKADYYQIPFNFIQVGHALLSGPNYYVVIKCRQSAYMLSSLYM